MSERKQLLDSGIAHMKDGQKAKGERLIVAAFGDVVAELAAAQERYELMASEARKVNRAWKEECDRAKCAEAEVARLRREFLAEQEDARQHLGRAMRAEAKVSRLRDALEAADAVYQWLAKEWPRVIREIPTPLWRQLRERNADARAMLEEKQ